MTTALPVPRFRWASSFMQTVEFEVIDSGSVYRVKLQESVSDYERNTYNGTPEEFERDVMGRLGLLRVASDPARRIPRSTIDAFNDWRTREHEEMIQKLRSQPERYGVLADDDPLCVPPARVDAAFWTDQGWVRY